MIVIILMALARSQIAPSLTITNLEGICFSKKESCFVAYQANIGRKADRLYFISERNHEITRVVDLPDPINLTGINEEGLPCFRSSQFPMSVLRGDRIESARNQLQGQTMLVRGKWTIQAFQRSLVAFIDGEASWIYKDHSVSSESFGIDETSGTFGIVQWKNDSAFFVSRDEKDGKLKQVKVQLPHNSTNAYPETSLEFVTPELCLVVFRLPKDDKTNSDLRPYLCSLSTTTGLITRLIEISLLAGDLPQAMKNDIAIGSTEFAVICSNTIRFMATNRFKP